MSAGLERLKAKLRSHGNAALAAGKAQAQKEATIIADMAKRLAPHDEGTLQRSIRVVDSDTIETQNGGMIPFLGYDVVAGDETTIVTNSRGVEFQKAKLFEGGYLHHTKDGGTMVIHAPFLNPAKRLRMKQARANILRAMNKAWRNGG